MPSLLLQTLPNEILNPILTFHILSPTTTPHAALSLRLLSKQINQEILYQLFTLGYIDTKLDPSRRVKRFNASGGVNCRVCCETTRPERRAKAINRETVRRYLFGWLSRESGRGDGRLRVWRRMKAAARWISAAGRESMTGAREVDGELEQESTPVPARETEMEDMLSSLVDAVITLFGVRDTWAYLGPHHTTCRPPGTQFPRHFEDPRPAEFWCLITAAYEGDVGMVWYLLDDSEISSAGPRLVMANMRQNSSSPAAVEKEEAKLDNWSTVPPRLPVWTPPVNSVAAALTIAIRLGHRDMVTMLLGMGFTRMVCCDVTFWNGRTVMGTLFAATADRNPDVAEVAVDTIKRILEEWRARDLWVKDRRWCVEHLRYALDIPTSSGILRDVLWSLLPNCALWDEDISNRLLFHLLCQAALTNDVERAREAIKVKASDAGKVVLKVHTWSIDDPFLLNPCNVADEYGVRSDRLLDAMNPIRIAAVLSHYEILEWLLGEGWEVQEKVKLWRLKATGWKKIRVAEDQILNASWNSTLLDARQEAVYDAFINRDRLPAYVEPASDPKILELILRKSEGFCWERETIISAGTHNVDIFEAFVKFVDLGKQVPQKVHKVKGKLFVEGAYARTVGERSLQHALKAGRFDNAKTLLLRGVKLAEAIRSDGFYHDDPEAMAILRGLQEMKLPGLSVVSRTMQVLYWVNGDVPLRLRQTKTIEENEKGYVWRNGQKLKRIGAPTFPISKAT